jgi:hypothetical protein
VSPPCDTGHLCVCAHASSHKGLTCCTCPRAQPCFTLLQMHDQSVAALNDIPALSFMRSPDQAPPPAITAPTAHIQRSQLAGPKTTWIPGLSAQSKLNTSNVLDATLMGASFVGRESDAISDLAALADLNDMSIMPSLYPRQQTHAPPAAEQPQVDDRELCGVGVILEQMHQGTGIIVEKIFAGGPAHLSGKLQEGDEIVSVNGSPINGRTPSELKTHVVGPSGTSVSLGVRNSSGQVYEIQLMRGPTPPEHKALLQQKPHLSPVSRSATPQSPSLPAPLSFSGKKAVNSQSKIPKLSARYTSQLPAPLPPLVSHACTRARKLGGAET